MPNPIKVEVGGVDLSTYFKGIDASPSGAGQTGTATLRFEKVSGGLTIKPTDVVKVWRTFDSGGNGVQARGRIFGGLVDARTEGNIGTTETWELPCVSFHVALTSVVRDATPAKAFNVPASDFDTMIAYVVQVVQENGNGTVAMPIDCVSQVANLYTGTIPTWTAPPGKNLKFYIDEVIRQMRLVVPAQRAAYFIDTGRTFGVGDTFGGAVLHVYDPALTPSPVYAFSDTPTGAEKEIYGKIERTTDARSLTQRKQAVYGDNFIATYQNTTSADAYPNPFINHLRPGSKGYWMQEAVADTQSTTLTQAENALALQVQPVEYPQERVVMTEVRDLVLPGEVVSVEYALFIPTPTNYRVVEVSWDFSDPMNDEGTLVLGTRRRELLDLQEEAVGAQPREGDLVGPEAPVLAAGTPVYNPERIGWDIPITITPSPSPDTDYLLASITRGGVTLPEQLAAGATSYTLEVNPATAWSMVAWGVDTHNNAGDHSNTLSGTTSAADVSATILNPSFEQVSGGTQANHWVYNTSSGGDVAVSDVGGGAAGLRYLLCDATPASASATATTQEYLECIGGRTYVFGVFAKAASAMASALTLKVHWYTSARVFISTATVLSALSVTTSWPNDPYEAAATAPATAAYCKIEVGDTTGSSAAALKVDVVNKREQLLTQDFPGTLDLTNKNLVIAGTGSITSSTSNFTLADTGAGAFTDIIVSGLTETADLNVTNDANIDDVLTTAALGIGGGTLMIGHLSATASLNFPSIAANTTAELTITVTGAASGDNVYVAPTGAPEAGLVWSAYVSAANTVTVRMANVTTGAIDPAARTYRADCWKH